MGRWVVAVLCGGALALASVASASAPTRYAWEVGLFNVVPGSTATEGIVSDAPVYGGTATEGPMCCQVTLSLERHFDAAVMRGSVSGTIVVGGNATDTVWQGRLRGSISPDGSSGKFVAVEESLDGGTTGRRLVGSWTVLGHADQSMPHVITIQFEGKLKE